jgi:ABC-type Fe3+-siderophore transport system permease subunit
LRLISIGHDFAQGVGVDVKKIQTYSLLVSLLLTGLVISFFGVFSFLGLIFPHLLRLIGVFRKDMRNELLYGGVITGVIFSVTDMLCYNFDIYGTELPVGMVSSVFGSLILLVLLVRKQFIRKY